MHMEYRTLCLPNFTLNTAAHVTYLLDLLCNLPTVGWGATLGQMGRGWASGHEEHPEGTPPPTPKLLCCLAVLWVTPGLGGLLSALGGLQRWWGRGVHPAGGVVPQRGLQALLCRGHGIKTPPRWGFLSTGERGVIQNSFSAAQFTAI